MRKIATATAARMLLAFLAMAAVYVANSTHAAPTGGFVSTDGYSVRDDGTMPSNVPTWRAEYATEYPGCVERVPAGTVPTTVLQVRWDGSIVRLSFDRAWSLTHDAEPANDGWIVAQCAR